MNIIFKENLPSSDQKYTVLELDTFSLPDGSQHTACCIIENMPIMELPQMQSLSELHANLISNYGKKDWDFCEQALEQLTGKWGGEVDSFYSNLKTRIEQCKTTTLDHDWSPVVNKL